MSSQDTIKKAHSIWKNHLRSNWSSYALGTVAVITTNIMQVIWTRGLGWIIDFFSGDPYPAFFQVGTTSENFNKLFIILFVSRIFLFLGRWGWRVTLARQTHFASANLRRDIFKNSRFFPKRDLDKTFTKGLLMNASTSDVNAARFIFGFTLVAVVDVVFLGIFTVWAMLSIHTGMTLWSLGVLLLLPYFVKKLSAIEIDKYTGAQEFLTVFNDLASQVISTIRLQRLTQTGEFWRLRLEDTAEEYRKQRLSAVYTSLLYSPLMGAVYFVSYLVIFIMGIKLVFEGSMTIGGFMAMQGLIFLIQDPLFELGFIISDWQKGKKSLERLSEIFLHGKEKWLLAKDGAPVKPQDEVLSAKNISFSYEEGRPVVKDFNLSLKHGERLGIKGPIGTGKSTLVSILAGLERENEGEVLFCGKEYNQYDHHEIRKSVCFVPQKPFLFAASIRENICMDRSFSDDEVWHALEVAGLNMDVRTFPEGLDTPLGEWGINLSGGQKQRLTLARALARKPHLLFLDDCLSAVDTVTEEKILKGLDKELSDTTLIWVAHRDSTLKYCDRVIEIKGEVLQ
jgi:ATP-binding cassette subfamily B multidrug efflux pump